MTSPVPARHAVRAVALFRSFISIPAGTERMSLPVFTATWGD